VASSRVSGQKFKKDVKQGLASGVVKPSGKFRAFVAAREGAVHDEGVQIESRKRSLRVKRSEAAVDAINEAMVEARKKNDLGTVALMRIDLKDAEKMWHFFVKEVREFLDGPRLPGGDMRDQEVKEITPHLATYETYFSPDRPRPPSPPNGPQGHFDGPFFGNHYEGQFLPWKRERHGLGTMKFSDGSKAVGT
jgi:hypothetical protein